MRILLDENLPKKLKLDFPVHEVFTVADMNWAGIKNGELLQLMVDNEFHAFATFDKNIEFQQNFSRYPLTVFILIAEINTYNTLTQLSSRINSYLEDPILKKGTIVVKL